MAEKTVKVTLRADVANYIRGMQSAGQATDELTRGGDNVEKWGDRWSGAAEKIGSQMLFAGAAITAGLGFGVKAAMDWESAWTGVLKTVDGTPAQLSAVEEGLRELTSVLPASHTEIAAVAEAAGQLGIATPNVVEFTRTMIDLGETTNLSAEEAATALARFMNIMGTSQDDVDRLGSALVGLGNNFATTEAEILEMAMRLAGAGTQIGMTEGDVLGLATALSSVGIEAEAGGSAMSKVMIDIAASVDKGGERLEQFAKVAGMSADDFAQKWRTEPGAALQAFVQGLADAESQGTTTLSILEELGITEVRMRDALLRASSAAGTFGDAMAMGNEEFEKNLALQQEAELRYGTTESKLGILRNRLTEAAITLGATLLPALEAVMSAVGDFADGLSGMDGPMAAIVAWGGVVAAALLLAGGAFLTLVPKIVATNVALQTLGINTGKATGALKNMFSLKGSIAITAFWAALELINLGLETARASADEAATSIRNAANATDVLEAAMSRTVSVGEFFGWRNDAEDAANLLADLTDRIQATQGAWYEVGQQGRDDIAMFQELGQVLADMDPSEAVAAFQELAASLPDEQIVQLLDLMPDYRDSLNDQAAGLGIVDGALDTYEEKLALAKWALEGGADASGELTGELDEQAVSAEQAAAAIDALADAIRSYDDLLAGMMNAEIGYYQAVDEATAALEKNGQTLDVTTEAGRENMSALLDLASQTNEWGASIIEAGGSVEEAGAAVEAGRQKFIEMAVAMGMAAPEAEALADELFGIPENVQSEVDVVTANAATELQGIIDQIGELNGPGIPPIVIDAITDTAKGKLEELGIKVVELDDGTWQVEFSADPTEAQSQLEALQAEIDGSSGTTTVNADDTPARTTVDGWLAATEATVAVSTADADAAEARGEVLAWKLEADGTWSVSHMDAEKAAADAKVVTWERDANGTYTISHMGAEAQSAYNNLHGFESSANSSWSTVNVSANTSAAEARIAALRHMAVTVAVNAVVSRLNADGGMYAYANGGLRSYANGGYGSFANPYRTLPSGIYPGGKPIYKFAEPETGWEVFVSGKRGRELQNLGYLYEAESRLLRQIGRTRAFAGGGGTDYQQARWADNRPMVVRMPVATSRSAAPITVAGPLVAVDQLVVDSDERVQQVSQDLWMRADRAARAQGKVNLGGAVE
ncbi:phage tail tape measure protein [Gulosibacter faecalis]|uniref:Phage tail tape measure protein n=1 Tax=Gulosibacter faecalis TaxID=272240 RepID=A0ABW5UUM8_9MICO|nr:phage tail tape measure protein [Gulosibacter faecalis]